METIEQKKQRVAAEPVWLVPYNPDWPTSFQRERQHLLECLPDGMIVRIEHFGSTSVPNLSAKPIVDVLIEVRDVAEARELVPRILEPQGYDCFWRPSRGEDIPPWYTWCIKRDALGQRTHHLQFVAPGSHPDELRFRDILRAYPQVASAYQALKLHLAKLHPTDRLAYTNAKGDFIHRTLDDPALRVS